MASDLGAAPMTEYVIFIVMMILTIGFARLWFVEQRKKRTRNEARLKKAIER